MYCTTCVFSHLAVFIMENLNNCIEYFSLVSQYNFFVSGTAFPSILLSFSKWVYNISITSQFAKCSRSHKCCGDKCKIFFLSIFLHKLCLIFQVWFLLFFPCEIHCTLAFAWISSWTKSIFDLILDFFHIFLLLLTDYGILLSKILYCTSLQFSVWLTQWPSIWFQLFLRVYQSRAVLSFGAVIFPDILGLLVSCKRRKRMTISASSPCYFSQYPPMFLVPRELFL